MICDCFVMAVNCTEPKEKSFYRMEWFVTQDLTFFLFHFLLFAIWLSSVDFFLLLFCFLVFFSQLMWFILPFLLCWAFCCCALQPMECHTNRAYAWHIGSNVERKNHSVSGIIKASVYRWKLCSLAPKVAKKQRTAAPFRVSILACSKRHSIEIYNFIC